MEFDQSQLAAIELCCSPIRVCAISGAAGTGKTTTMRTVFERLTDAGWRVAMCAPTGKAARRISQATGISALTIHKLLDFPSPGEIDEKTGQPLLPSVPRRNRLNPLDENCILIDEAPMVSNGLMAYIYEALPTGGIVRMWGDMNQLPPIESTSEVKAPFWEILNKVTRNPLKREATNHGAVLSRIYRQESESGILKNSEYIICGRYPVTAPDFMLETTQDLVLTIKRMIAKPTSANYSLLTNQIIIPMRKGNFGTTAVNEVLRRHYNASPISKLRLLRHPWDDTGAPYYVGIGDKVIMTKNWYDIGKYGVRNGETGVVVDISEAGELIVNFDEEIVAIPNEVVFIADGRERTANPQRDIELAYAITTHKAQGSEYENVIYAFDDGHKYVLHRNNFYTAVTRAQKNVICIYNPRAMRYALAVRPLSRSRAK